jgi:hypothetical protein
MLFQRVLTLANSRHPINELPRQNTQILQLGETAAVTSAKAAPYDMRASSNEAASPGALRTSVYQSINHGKIDS